MNNSLRVLNSQVEKSAGNCSGLKRCALSTLTLTLSQSWERGLTPRVGSSSGATDSPSFFTYGSSCVYLGVQVVLGYVGQEGVEAGLGVFWERRFDLMGFDGEGDAGPGACLEAEGDGFVFGVALAGAAGDGGELDDPGAVFVSVDGEAGLRKGPSPPS